MRVFESKLLGTTFGFKEEEETRRRMKVRNNEYHDVYPCFSPYIIGVIRSKEWDGRDVWHA